MTICPESVDTSDEWIVSRTGIRERRIVASPKETTATMSIAAAKEALEVAGITPGEIDLDHRRHRHAGI